MGRGYAGESRVGAVQEEIDCVKTLTKQRNEDLHGSVLLTRSLGGGDAAVCVTEDIDLVLLQCFPTPKGKVVSAHVLTKPRRNMARKSSLLPLVPTPFQFQQPALTSRHVSSLLSVTQRY